MALCPELHHRSKTVRITPAIRCQAIACLQCPAEELKLSPWDRATAGLTIPCSRCLQQAGSEMSGVILLPGRLLLLLTPRFRGGSCWVRAGNYNCGLKPSIC